METVFATHGGCVRNTAGATRGGWVPALKRASRDDATSHVAEGSSGLGGQIGELAAALDAVGWNHNRVPLDERVPASEAQHASHGSVDVAKSGLGGQIGELAAALGTVGWNHNQVPPGERIPLQERT